jgi:hypothetical protein
MASKTINDVNKSVWMLITHVKDTTSKTISEAVNSGVLKLDANQREQVCTLVNAAIDAGANQAFTNFEKVMKSFLEDYVKSIGSVSKKSK